MRIQKPLRPESIESSGLMTKCAVRMRRFVSWSSQGCLKLQLTPTLVLLDRQRKALRIWVGQLSAADEADVLKQVLDGSS